MSWLRFQSQTPVDVSLQIENNKLSTENRYLYQYFLYQYIQLDKFKKKLQAKRYRPFIGFRRSLVRAHLVTQ